MTTPTTPNSEVVITEDGSSVTAQHPQHLLAQTRIKELEQLLLTKDPMMKGHLAEIHKLMSSYEELVHLLTEDEIAVFIAGMQAHSQTVLIADAVKKGSSKAGSKSSAGNKITLDML